MSNPTDNATDRIVFWALNTRNCPASSYILALLYSSDWRIPGESTDEVETAIVETLRTWTGDKHYAPAVLVGLWYQARREWADSHGFATVVPQDPARPPPGMKRDTGSFWGNWGADLADDAKDLVNQAREAVKDALTPESPGAILALTAAGAIGVLWLTRR